MKKFVRLLLVVAALTAIFFAGIKLRVGLAPRVAFGQAASYQVIQFTFGANANGRPTLYPSTQVIDTVTAVAAGTLNGTNSPAYDVIAINEHARMVNVSFNVTAVPGTAPSLTPSIQQSDDGGISWYQVVAQDGTTFAAITATGAVAGKDFPVYGDLLRIHYVSSGTGNFSFTDTAKQSQ